jgi:antirestriction protein ArdC
MLSQKSRARTSQDRASLYTEITDRIVDELEAGRIPWVQPWGTAAIKAPEAYQVSDRSRSHRQRD